MNKLAIVQFESVHEEIVPSVNFFFEKFECFTYLNEKIKDRRGDFFQESEFKGINYKYVPIAESSDWDLLEKEISQQFNPDIVLMNTYQRKSTINWSLRLGKPIIGIVHNPEMFLDIENIKSILRENRKIYLLGLAPHVANFIISKLPFMQDRVGFIDPIIWSEKSKKTEVLERKKKVISIPGSINFSNRDYKSLLSEIKKLSTHGSSDIQVHFLGGGKDRNKLLELIKDEGVSDYFTFSEVNNSGFVPYHTYLHDLKNSDFLLPMFKRTDVAYRTYKISSVISSSIGNRIPLIQDRWTSLVYNPQGLEYSRGRLFEAFNLISSMKSEELGKHFNNVKDTYKQWEYRSTQEIKNLMNFFEIENE